MALDRNVSMANASTTSAVMSVCKGVLAVGPVHAKLHATLRMCRVSLIHSQILWP